MNDPEGTQKKVEEMTRKLPGVKYAPIDGIPHEE